MFLPMLASPLEIGDKPNQWAKMGNYWMEPKLDGMRLLLDFDWCGNVNAYTRSGREVTDQLPQGWVELYHGMFMFDVLLDCEFGYMSNAHRYMPQIDFNKTMRVMGSNPGVAQTKAAEHDDLPTAFVFDVLRYKGSDVHAMQQSYRRQIIDDILPIDNELRKMPLWGPWDEPQYLTYCENGGEGAILKNPLAPYRTGLTRNERPTQTWYKIKKFDTVDVQITGFQAGQGKYTGLIGAIVFVNPVTGIIGKCSGMTDEQRIDFTQRSKAGNMFGDWMEIRYFGLTVGTPRHPQFVRLRPDR